MAVKNLNFWNWPLLTINGRKSNCHGWRHKCLDTKWIDIFILVYFSLQWRSLRSTVPSPPWHARTSWWPTCPHNVVFSLPPVHCLFSWSHSNDISLHGKFNLRFGNFIFRAKLRLSEFVVTRKMCFLFSAYSFLFILIISCENLSYKGTCWHPKTDATYNTKQSTDKSYSISSVSSWSVFHFSCPATSCSAWPSASTFWSTRLSSSCAVSLGTYPFHGLFSLRFFCSPHLK